MKYDYYLQIGKEETKCKSKQEALIKSFKEIKAHPRTDIIIFSKCKGERRDSIPSIIEYIAEGGTVNQAPKKAKVAKPKKEKEEGVRVIKAATKKTSKFDKKVLAQGKMAEKLDGKSWVNKMGLTIRPRPKKKK